MTDDLNPYASSHVPPAPMETDDERTGPAWEQPGALAVRFTRTLLACLIHGSSGFFRQMRRGGGWLAPISFAVAATWVFGGIGTAIDVAIAEEATSDWFERLLPWAILLLVPVIMYAQTLILAATHHVLLLACAARPYSFETTVRVVAYATGCAAPFLIVPGNGGAALAFVAQLVFTAIGLREAHPVRGLIAIFATTAPLIACIGGVVFVLWQLDRAGLLQ